VDIATMKNIVARVFATFLATGLGVIGAGAIAGVPIATSVLMAGIGGVATVVEGLSRSFLNDGKLSADEVNAVFAKVQNGTYAKEQVPLADEDAPLA